MDIHLGCALVTNQILILSLAETLIKEASSFLGTAEGIIHEYNKYYKLSPLFKPLWKYYVGNDILPHNGLLKAAEKSMPKSCNS